MDAASGDPGSMGGPPDEGAVDVSPAVDAERLLDDLPIGALEFRATPDGLLRATWLNPAAARILGLDSTAGRGLADLEEMVEFADPADTLTNVLDLRAHPRDRDWEGELLVWGERRRVRACVTPVGLLPDGDLLLHASIEDVTERHRAQEAGAQLAAELAEAQRVGGVGSWSFRVGQPHRWSDEMYRIHGLAPGTPIPDEPAWYARFLEPADFAALAAHLRSTLDRGGSYELEHAIRRPDGTRRHVLSRGSAIVAPDGAIAGARGTTIDVTDLALTRRALQDRELELSESERLAQVGGWVLHADGSLTWTDECFRIHGLNPATDLPVLDGYFELFGPAPGQAELQRLIARGLERGTPYLTEYSIRRADGELRHLLARGRPVRVASGAITGLRGSVADITDLVEARQALTASERLHRTLVDELAEAVVVQDWTGAIVMANPAASRVLGIRHDDLTGLTSTDPRWQALREDGTPWPGEDHPSMVTIRTGLPVHDALMQIARPDGERVWLRINSSPLLDEAGRATAAVVSFEDITAARAALEAQRRFGEELEARVVERTAELAAANEELRVFSATLSHDLRAPVRAVAGFARLLQRRYGPELEPEAAHWVDNLVEAGETMGRLVDDFLAYARLGRDGLRSEPVDVEAILGWLRMTLGDRIAESGGSVQGAGPLDPPMGDPAMVRRMLLNLVDNALAYALPGVPPVVVIRADREGDQVVVSVTDNGQGIKAAAQEHIFEVFARLQPEQDLAHAGIGLAMVRKAARAMGTDVTVESTVGCGSRFSFSLPAAAAAAASVAGPGR